MLEQQKFILFLDTEALWPMFPKHLRHYQLAYDGGQLGVQRS